MRKGPESILTRLSIGIFTMERASRNGIPAIRGLVGIQGPGANLTDPWDTVTTHVQDRVSLQIDPTSSLTLST
jgi:hypothetical protein